MSEESKERETRGRDEVYKPRTFFVGGRAVDLLEHLEAELGWSQHEIVTRAIELLWAQDKKVDSETGEENTPDVSLARILKRIEHLEQRVKELEEKKEDE